MVPRPTILLLALAASAIGAPAVQSDNAVDMKVPEQTPEEAANSDQGHVVVNVFGNPDVEPMCRANDVSKYIFCIVLTCNPLTRTQDANSTLAAAPAIAPGTRVTSVWIERPLSKKRRRALSSRALMTWNPCAVRMATVSRKSALL